MVTQPILERKKISREWSSESCLPPFGVRYCPWGLREGGSKMGQNFGPCIFVR